MLKRNVLDSDANCGGNDHHQHRFPERRATSKASPTLIAPSRRIQTRSELRWLQRREALNLQQNGGSSGTDSSRRRGPETSGGARLRAGGDSPKPLLPPGTDGSPSPLPPWRSRPAAGAGRWRQRRHRSRCQPRYILPDPLPPPSSPHAGDASSRKPAERVGRMSII